MGLGCVVCHLSDNRWSEPMFRGNVKKNSLFKDIIQIKVDHPPSYPIFDKLFFDKF